MVRRLAMVPVMIMGTDLSHFNEDSENQLADNIVAVQL